MRCVVCGRTPAATQLTAGGKPYGPTCNDQLCGALAWEGHFNAAVGAPAADNDRLAWEMRRQRAHRNGLAFGEPAPKSPAERRLDILLVDLALEDLAAEVE